MSETLEVQFREGRRVTQLWAGILLGPAAWVVDFVLSYAVTHHECSTGAMLWHRTSSVIAVLVALWAAYLGWDSKGRLPDDVPIHEGTVLARSRAMAIAGMWMGLWFAMIIIAEAVPRFILSPCD
jgi:hypothetical protein